MFRILRSIRTTITIWYGSVLVIALGGFVGAAYFYLRHQLETVLEEDIVAEAEWIDGLVTINRLSPEDKPDALPVLPPELRQIIIDHFRKDPRNFSLILSTTTGSVLYESSALPIPQNVPLEEGIPSVLSLVSADGEVHRVAHLRHGSLIVSVALSEHHITAVLSHLVTIIMWIAPVAVFVAVLGGWVLAGLALRPVDEVAERAARISVHNLTERLPERKTQDELGRLITTVNYMIARLEGSFNQMRDFLLNVAHELKTPLTVIRGEAELALGGAMDQDEVKALLASHLEETVRMSRIVDDLLVLAKADAGQMTIERTPVEMDRLVEELYDDAVILASGKNIRVDLETNQPGTVVGDRGRLRQLFRILVTNAVQYTDEGGSVTLASRNEGGVLRFTVKDSGIGIRPEDLPRIFDRFFRSEAARERSRSGTGLGLSLAKSIVEIHGGSIDVRSEKGQGTSFEVTLPAAV